MIEMTLPLPLLAEVLTGLTSVSLLMSALGHKKTLVNGSAQIRIVPVARPKGNVMTT